MSQMFANLPVAAAPAETGRNEVPGAAQSVKGPQLAAHSCPKSDHFGKSARAQGRFRIVAQPEPVPGAGRDREDVFQRAAQFDSRDFVAGIDSKTRRAQMTL